MGHNFAKLAFTAGLAASMIMITGAQAFAVPLGGLTRQAPAVKRPGLFLVARSAALPPFAFTKFCVNSSDQCNRRGQGTIIDLTGAKRALMQRINLEVNTNVTYAEEADGVDEWKIGQTSGDCEDIAITKRKRLLSAGWPSGALRIATGITREGIGHAVLIVTTSKGDLVLDNRTNIVKPWFATDLRWGKIQSPEDPRRWSRL